MKTVFLHGLGHTARVWDGIINDSSLSDVDCPELFLKRKQGNLTYHKLLDELSEDYSNVEEPFVICGHSLGAVLALDYTMKHPEKVASLILIAGQYKTPEILLYLQCCMFRCMPQKAFQSTGITKSDMISLMGSMHGLDFSKKSGAVSCPVAIICGENDQANRKASEQMSRLFLNANLYIIPGAGHEVNKEKPQEIAEIISGILTAID
ncbi:MAG: alpha/beta fold hydrolase [Lachnospiraceae bacterium]|nr:alpha/beta fold hydrolase [Lachnospiraceae bacterium]